MTVNRGPGVAPIAGVGTTTVEHRLQLAGLYAENAPGVPRSGVLAQATDQLVVSKSDWSYDVGPAALVIGRTAGEGVYTPTLTGTTNVPTDVAPATDSRWDLIYIKQNDQAKGDADNAPVIGVQKGAAAASPTKPTADLPSGAYVLAEARIFAGTSGTVGGSNTVSQVWVHTAARGASIPVRTVAERNVLTPFVGLQVCRLDRDGWTQTYTGVGSSGWEYTRPSRRVYAVVNGTNLVNETGSASRVIYTMPAAGLTKSYPQTVNVVARIALLCPPIASGALQEWLAVSANQSQVTNAQGRASVTFTVSTATVLETLQAETGPLTVAAGADPFARMWIERPTASAVDTTVSSDLSFTQMYIDLRPQDD